MLTYIIRRLLLMVPTLIGMTMVVFFVMAAAPGGISANLMTRGGDLNPKEREAMEEYLNQRYGLNDPAPVQYLRWMNNASPLGFYFDDERNLDGFGFKDPDLGNSFVKNRPVADLIAESLPITLLLNLIAFPIIYMLAITMGVYTARFRGGATDIVIGTGNLALWSIPTMWAGVMLIGVFASEQYLNWFPTSRLHDLQSDSMTFLPVFADSGFEKGYLLDWLHHLILPIICLTYNGFAFLSKLTRSAVLENLLSDYSRTARAKGVPDRVVLWRHVFRNSLLPLITHAATILPALLAGSVIVESIFTINGMGQLVVEATQMRDREVVLSVAMISGALTLIAYLLADIAYAIADPRVSYE